jgi:hypothetical protein
MENEIMRGLTSFREWFRGFENNYAVIGGTACALLLQDIPNVRARTTKDIDIVLLIEVLTPEFGKRFWEYVKEAGYEHISKSGELEFYRFTNPKSGQYPEILELFSRGAKGISLPSEAVFTRIPLGEDISSLSAILLNEEYYSFLKNGVRQVDGIPILDELHLIPFKARAWLDLLKRRQNGGQVDRADINKHKSDIYRLLSFFRNMEFNQELPAPIAEDIREFVKTVQGQGTLQKGERKKLECLAAVFGLEDFQTKVKKD